MAVNHNPELGQRVQAEIAAVLSNLSEADKDRIIGRMLWYVFGDLDEDEEDVVLPDREMDDVDVECVQAELREAFWPWMFPAGRKG